LVSVFVGFRGSFCPILFAFSLRVSWVRPGYRGLTRAFGLRLFFSFGGPSGFFSFTRHLIGALLGHTVCRVLRSPVILVSIFLFIFFFPVFC